MLMKIAEDTAAERTQADASILSAYLVGTVLEGEPLLGGAADIDLVFIYDGPGKEREIVRMTADVHLDILHHPKSDYEQARDLRQTPWLGHAVYACKPLYDPDHFLDFVQATVRGLFFDHENIALRAGSLLESARGTWLRFHNKPPRHGPKQVWEYLDALECTANAVACLNRPPLTERRLLLEFPASAEAVDQPGLFPGLLGLLGGSEVEAADIEAWLPDWEECYELVNQSFDAPISLHTHRLGYYRKAFDGLLTVDPPQVVLWPLVRTWTLAAISLPPGIPQVEAWRKACEQLGLTGEWFEERLEGFDAYLDRVEELFEQWREERGV